MSSEDRDLWKEGTLVDNRYRVLGIIGEGAMGRILAARDEWLDCMVALKVMRDRVDESTTERFFREVRAAAAIRNEHVARVLNAGALRCGATYMVMELLDGRDLAVLLRERGKLSIHEAVDILLQVCEAMAEAHAHGIVHRDLKPANIFVQDVHGEPVVKVLDFGISKVLQPGGQCTLTQGLTGTGAWLGTPAYMAPEQIRSARQVDERADVWALGAILHEIIAGHPPFAGDSVYATSVMIATGRPPRLRHLRPDTPAGIEKIVRCCLEKDLARRMRSVAHLAMELEPFAPGGRHPSVTRIRRMSRWNGASSEGTGTTRSGALLRRHPRAVATMALAAAASAIFSVFGSRRPSPVARVGGPCGDMTALQASAPWPMEGYCPTHQGRSPFVGPSSARVKWRYPLRGQMSHPSPVIAADGTIYIGSTRVHAVSSEGEALWDPPYETWDGLATTAAIASDGTVYIGSYGNILYALSPNGTLKWSFTADSAITGAPATGRDGTIYFGSDGLYALAPTGDVRWKLDLGDSVGYSAVAIAEDDTLYIATKDGHVHAATPAGRRKWSFKAIDTWSSSPAVGADGTVYVASYGLYAIDSHGRKRWHFALKERSLSSPAIGPDGTIYFGCDDHHLYAVRPDGDLRWSYRTGKEVHGTPTVDAAGAVLFGSQDGKVYALTFDGKHIWSLDVEGRGVKGSPVISQSGTLYVATDKGDLVAIEPEQRGSFRPD